MNLSPSQKVFRSRISVLLILFTLAIFIPISISFVQNKTYQGSYVLGASLLLTILPLTGMRYIISGRKLFCKIWSIPCWNIEIADILSVKRSYNPLSSPAASLKRLRISIRGKGAYSYMLISPIKEQKFIDALETINPYIDINVPEKRGIWRIWDWDI